MNGRAVARLNSMTDELEPVAVSRRISAPAHSIFVILASPARHPDFDGSGMLRGAVTTSMVSGAGDIFVMKMYYSELGDYEMNNHVVEYEEDRRIGWEPEPGRGHPRAAPSGSGGARAGQRWSYQLTPDGPDATIVTEIYDCSRAPEERRRGMDDGKIWVDCMTRTLERLDRLCEDEKIRPFRIAVPDSELADLRDRLDRVRWAPEPRGGDQGYGIPLAFVRPLVAHWRERYDWRAWERRINEYPQFTTTIDGTGVHFLHVRSPEADPLPLVLSHGWPGSVAEYLDVIGPLSDPRRHGLDPAIAFDLVIPSLPGFGWSGPTPDVGWSPRRIAAAWAVLMRRLGYRRYGAAGNDWGAYISPELGQIAPDEVVGVHVTQVFPAGPGEVRNPSYGHVHAEQPQTLAHALADSPVGLLAWNSQVMTGLDPDALLTHVTIHWLTGTAGSAPRIYAEEDRQQPPSGPTTIPPGLPVPLGLAQFPNDWPSDRAQAERQGAPVLSWNVYDRGGHYAARQAPDLLVQDMREFFARCRSTPPPPGTGR
jgi:epoxide hydrolase